MQELIIAIKFTVIVGFISFVLGQICPRSFIDYNNFPYRPAYWEENGKYYDRKFCVSKWKDHVPDMSKVVKRMYPKKITKKPDSEMIMRLINETCIAESSHYLLILLSPYLLWEIGGGLGLFYMLLYIACNIPFIMIQRYNRPRFIRMYERFFKKTENTLKEDALNLEV